ncbi:MAG: class I SAM-dependent methyltransferase [Bacteroidota bacterium]|nr:class I SAM-dependent methyltransferase [Bacteroidota bacterium]
MFIADLPIYKKLTKQRSITFAKYLAPLISDNSTVLDFGCGNMYTAQQLLRINPTFNFTGIDVIRDQNLSDEILKDKRLNLVVSSAEILPFEDNSFDCVLALATMHHTPDPDYFMAELYRVTKTKGSLILVEEMYVNQLDRLYISGQDWILNKLKEGVPVPLNFRSNQHYENLFKKLKLDVVFKGSVRPFPTFMHHYVYKLKK